MKKNWASLIVASLAMATHICNAEAKISMPEREHVQTVVWLGEFISFATAVVIAVVVWRISKRASKNKKSERDDS